MRKIILSFILTAYSFAQSVPPTSGNFQLTNGVANPQLFVWGPYSCNSSNVCSKGGSSGASLSSGNNTLTVTPVPQGFNASNTNGAVYVSGGTGASESCPFTGTGTAVGGAISGNVQINCAGTHTGAFTIQSDSSGIREAVNYFDPTIGGRVLAPPGTYNIYSTNTIVVPRRVTLAGSGDATALNYIPTSGAALMHADTLNDSTEYKGEFRDFKLQGNCVLSTGCIGYLAGADPDNVIKPGVSWRGDRVSNTNLWITGFNEGVEYGNNAYNIVWDNVSFDTNYNGLQSGTPAHGMGNSEITESFLSCHFVSNVNAGIYQYNGGVMYLWRGSFEYNHNGIVLDGAHSYGYTGVFTLDASYFETWTDNLSSPNCVAGTYGFVPCGAQIKAINNAYVNMVIQGSEAGYADSSYNSTTMFDFSGAYSLRLNIDGLNIGSQSGISLTNVFLASATDQIDSYMEYKNMGAVPGYTPAITNYVNTTTVAYKLTDYLGNVTTYAPNATQNAGVSVTDKLTGSICVGCSDPTGDTPLDVSSGSSASPYAALRVRETTNSGSKRAAYQLGQGWLFLQDIAINGTRDFGLYNIPNNLFPIEVSPTGNIGIDKAPSTLTFDINGSLGVEQINQNAMSLGSVSTTNARDLFYNYGSGNWAGQGVDSSGNYWLRTGLSTDNVLSFDANGNLTVPLALNAYGNVGGAQFYVINGTSSLQIVQQTTTGGGCSSALPCIDIGNIRNLSADDFYVGSSTTANTFLDSNRDAYFYKIYVGTYGGANTEVVNQLGGGNFTSLVDTGPLTLPYSSTITGASDGSIQLYPYQGTSPGSTALAFGVLGSTPIMNSYSSAFGIFADNTELFISGGTFAVYGSPGSILYTTLQSPSGYASNLYMGPSGAQSIISSDASGNMTITPYNSDLQVVGSFTASSITSTGGMSVAGNIVDTGGYFNCGGTCTGYEMGGVQFLNTAKQLINIVDGTITDTVYNAFQVPNGGIVTTAIDLTAATSPAASPCYPFVLCATTGAIEVYGITDLSGLTTVGNVSVNSGAIILHGSGASSGTISATVLNLLGELTVGTNVTFLSMGASAGGVNLCITSSGQVYKGTPGC